MHDKWLDPNKYATIVCRPALPKDTPDVIALTHRIWEGEDYVPEIWPDWLADPEGLLAVAEYGGRVVGLGKLTRLSENEWWMEGLRVHPDFEGRGFASHLNDYVLDFWKRNGSGVVRLATGSYNEPVHRMCKRSGFIKVGEYTSYSAPLLPGDEKRTSQAFSSLKEIDVPKATNLATRSPAVALSFDLMDLGWKWAIPKAEYISRAVGNQAAWRWRGGRGLLLTREDAGEEDERILTIQLLACSVQDLAECLQDLRGWLPARGYGKVNWFAPVRPEMEPVLKAAGFQRRWEDSLFIYEKASEA
ncbi:MAG TPA: GNAT family N-acetyltransferase [Anaerolineales bacterium]|nr:GNAT family N-acetyltransferase [Anaerolineales bacterium]